MVISEASGHVMDMSLIYHHFKFDYSPVKEAPAPV